MCEIAVYCGENNIYTHTYTIKKKIMYIAIRGFDPRTFGL